MSSLLAWYVLVVVFVFAALLLAGVYVQSNSAGDFDTKWNTPIGWLLVAALIGIVAVGVIGVYGTVVRVPRRGTLLPYLAHTVPLVAGCVLLAVAAGHTRLVLLFRRAESRPIGSFSSSTGPVIATGEVDATSYETSPALSQPAVCWTWQFSIRGVSGQTDDSWLVRQADSGGVPFALGDDSGSIRVDPRESTIRLPMVDEHICPADGRQPGRVGRELHRSTPGDEYRYQEAIVADGDRLSVLGTVDDETLVATRIYRPARAAVASRQYARHAAAAAIGGVLTVGAGILLAARYFQTPIPFL